MENQSLDFSHYWPIFLRRRWIIFSMVAFGTIGTAIVNFSMRPVFEARTMVLIEKEGMNTLSQEGVKVESQQDDYYQTQYEILKSRTLATKVSQDLRLEDHPEFAGLDPIQQLQENVRILPIRRSRLVHIAAQFKDPQLAADVANSLAKAYAVQNLESRLFLSKEVLRALENQDTTASIESLPAVVNSPLVQELKVNLARLQASRAELSSRYQPRHPRMIQLKAEVEETRSQLEREIRHIAESVKIQLSGQLQGNNVRIIDTARVPKHPTKPNKRKNLTLAFFLSLLAGFGLALLVDSFDLKIRSQQDLEKLVRLPFLGGVMKIVGFDGGRPHAFHKIWGEVHSQAAESFRNLRTAISFRLSTIKGPTTLLVTSSIQGEGKSFICANLARAFAQAGERVLLIDGDLRRPTQHRLFELSNEKGLSSYLLEGNSPADYMQDGTIPNLKIIPCGPIPDNPAELLTDKRLKALFGWAVNEFDRILVDSTPVFPITDAQLWGKQVHGVVFVVKANQARAVLVQRGTQILKEGFSNIIGGVLNHSDLGFAGSSYYYYYYLDDSKKKKSLRPEQLASR